MRLGQIGGELERTPARQVGLLEVGLGRALAAEEMDEALTADEDDEPAEGRREELRALRPQLLSALESLFPELISDSIVLPK